MAKPTFYSKIIEKEMSVHIITGSPETDWYGTVMEVFEGTVLVMNRNLTKPQLVFLSLVVIRRD